MKMSGFYSKEELEAMHFKSLGKNVSISRKASLYHTEEMEIGNNVRIEDFCVLNGNITIGNNVMICVFCLLDRNCGIVIEDNVTIAARVSIHSGTDDYSGRSLFGCFAPMEYRIYRYAEQVTIKRHVLIGDGAVIMPGVVISEGTSIGAMSFVKDDTEEWSVCAGVPAKKIKNRYRDVARLYEQVKQEL